MLAAEFADILEHPCFEASASRIKSFLVCMYAKKMLAQDQLSARLTSLKGEGRVLRQHEAWLDERIRALLGGKVPGARPSVEGFVAENALTAADINALVSERTQSVYIKNPQGFIKVLPAARDGRTMPEQDCIALLFPAIEIVAEQSDASVFELQKGAGRDEVYVRYEGKYVAIDIFVGANPDRKCSAYTLLVDAREPTGGIYDQYSTRLKLTAIGNTADRTFTVSAVLNRDRKIFVLNPNIRDGNRTYLGSQGSFSAANGRLSFVPTSAVPTIRLYAIETRNPITLNWSYNGNESAFRIWYRGNNNEQWSLLANVTGTSANVRVPNREFEFRVTPARTELPESNIVEVVDHPEDETAGEVPVVVPVTTGDNTADNDTADEPHRVTVSATANRVTLTWPMPRPTIPVVGAPPLDTDIQGSFQTTCTNCKFKANGKLECSCPTEAGGNNTTSSVWPYCERVENMNGILTCIRPAWPFSNGPIGAADGTQQPIDFDFGATRAN